MASIAIIGAACRYPDARCPAELWENVLAQRRAFRRIPSERLRLEDYFSADRDDPDCTYSTEAAVVEGYEFDRVRFRVSGSTFRSVDMAHWLALDVASQALDDAGFPDGRGLPRESTGVLLGNTLTGEFSRACLMRLRWPYVSRVVDASLTKRGWAREQCGALLEEIEAQYKAPFPPVGEETLAGGLSNTIAGRICNYFDLKGGGYTVDGACAASLLAVAQACSALAAGDLDVALAGGVDLSLDPFELVGFAKVGALANQEMRVYDAHSSGFLPGEGCGFVVLMRQEEAQARSRRIYAIIRGWGISSDGSGGITRPEVEGHLLALRRAYRRAAVGIETVEYFEGHGTGTTIGDAAELRALTQARREATPTVPPAAVGSIKANIGHTKAAAGIAGLIKATLAVHTQILPPATGTVDLPAELAGESPALRILREAEPWPAERALRAGVSAMGFGGINTHLVLEGIGSERRSVLSGREHVLSCSAQDAELFLFGARQGDELERKLKRVADLAPRLSRAELGDLAARLASDLEVGERAQQSARLQSRAGIVASSPAELASRVEELQSILAAGLTNRLDLHAGIFLGLGREVPHIGFAFPGQGVPVYLDGGALGRRFGLVRELFDRLDLRSIADDRSTERAQPAIVLASLAGLRVLDALGITATVALGHSLGELTALGWSGALDEEALLRIASTRGRAMAECGNGGAMASLAAGQQPVEELLAGTPVVLAGLNSPRQTVVSGEAGAVSRVVAAAREKGVRAVIVPVSYAFHSPLVAPAAPVLAEQLRQEHFRPLQRTVVSTVTGERLAPDANLRALLCQQVTSPVRFMEAVHAAGREGLDLWIEVGPGHLLGGLLPELCATPSVSLDGGGPSLRGLLQAFGAAFVLGARVDSRALFAGRFVRPFDLDWRPKFFINPCELAPISGSKSGQRGAKQAESARSPAAGLTSTISESPLNLVRQLVAERTELPLSAVTDDDRLLSDLHLNSITVGQLVAEAARRMGLTPPTGLTEYADATVAQTARALEDLGCVGGGSRVESQDHSPQGVDTWVRPFTVELVERPLRRSRRAAGEPGRWQVIGLAEDALVHSLRQVFSPPETGRGIVVCLPPEFDERSIELLLEGGRVVLSEQKPGRFVLVLQSEAGVGAAFARSLHLEFTEVPVCVVNVPPGHREAGDWVLTEALAGVGYCEAHYDASGRRSEPVLRVLPIENQPPTETPLDRNDVFLVTGGGKGIAVECALALARETGASLIIAGRTRPEDDNLVANLGRIKGAGVRCRYVVADVTDAEQIRLAVREAENDLGPVTALLHGAARNVPCSLRSLDKRAFMSTLAPKVQGLRNVVAAIDPGRLRLLITFGSLIARTGMQGDADYAVANELLTRLTEDWQARHPHCRCHAVEWSVWSGIGMGQRLGRIEAFLQQGITPISPEEGVRILSLLLCRQLPKTSIVVTGRFGSPPTLQRKQEPLPLLRFLERARVYFPGVELVADVELSRDSDPYLDDHILQGERIFPAVMGLEAMAQVAMAVAGVNRPPAFTNVRFARPIVVPERGATTIRLATLVREPGRVEVALRTASTAFQVDHFRATCDFTVQPAGESGSPVSQDVRRKRQRNGDYLALDPERDLYGVILFHSGRFQRLRGYRLLQARECRAEIAIDGAANWFGRYLPAQLVLGNPGVRDAVVHAIQACIPHARLLPIGVDRLVPGTGEAPGPCFVHARERARDGRDIFVYDVDVTGPEGGVRERWKGLRLRRVAHVPPSRSWAAPLYGPYIERRVEELIPAAAVSVVLEPNGGLDGVSRSDRTIQRALGKKLRVLRRADGKPYVAGDCDVSAAHADGLTLAVAGPRPVGCDLEPVVPRPPAVWKDLLGGERFSLASVIAQEAAEDQDAAATRVWAAIECLKKAGAAVNAPLALVSAEKDGWVELATGPLVTVSLITSVRDAEKRLALAVLVNRSSEPNSEAVISAKALQNA